MFKRREIVVFGVGLLLFVAGAVNLVLAQLRTAEVVPEAPGTPASRSSLFQTNLPLAGPSPGEDLVAYIENKRGLLKAKAAKEGRTQSFAAVSFVSYESGRRADEVIGGTKLEPQLVQVRVPNSGEDPEQIALVDGSVKATVAAYLKVKVPALRAELRELETIIPTTEDPEFRAVYEEDAGRKRKSIEALSGDPRIVFAVVLRGTYSSLARIASIQGVRLVDVPSDPAWTPVHHRFVGLLPERPR